MNNNEKMKSFLKLINKKKIKNKYKLSHENANRQRQIKSSL